MLTRALARGFSTLVGRPALVFTAWAWSLALAWLAALPAARWWGSGFDLTPASDPLLDGFNLALFADLANYDRTPTAALVQASAAGALLVALLTGPMIAGGVLEVLTVDDRRSFLHRFFRGAGHFYGRFLRLGLLAGVAGVLVAGLVSAAATAALQPLAQSAWEPGWAAAIAIQAVAVGLVALFFLLALDYARIQVALDDSRKMLAAWLAGLRFVLRRPGASLAIAAVFVAIMVALVAIYLVIAANGRFATSGAILLLVVLQQAVMLLRTGARVAWTDAEVSYFAASRPAVAVQSPVPAAPEPSSVETAPPDATAEAANGGGEEDGDSGTDPAAAPGGGQTS